MNLILPFLHIYSLNVKKKKNKLKAFRFQRRNHFANKLTLLAPKTELKKEFLKIHAA